MTISRKLMALAMILGIGGCGGEGTEPTPTPASITLSPTSLTFASLGESQSLTATVRDASGNPIAVTVSWSTDNPAVVSITGAGSTITVTANGNGMAAVIASAGGIQQPANVTVEQIAVSLQPASGDGQAALVEVTLPAPLVATVADALGSPMTDAGIDVTFTVSGNGGMVDTPNATTDANGEVSTQWTFGTTSGDHTVTASAAGFTSAIFSATANPDVASDIQQGAGNNQTGAIGGVLKLPLVVQVRDRFGNPVPDETVTFTVTGGTGSVNPMAPMSDALGAAGTVWTLGPEVGAQQLTADAPGLGGSPITFDATAIIFELTGTNPAELVEGSTVTLQGQGFDAIDPANNVVTIGGTTVPSGNISNVTGTSMDVLVPIGQCEPAADVDVTVGLSDAGVTSAPLNRRRNPAAFTDIAVGEQAVFSSTSDFCIQLRPETTDRSYVVGLTIPREVPTQLLPFRMAGVTGASTSAPAPALRAARTASRQGLTLTADDRVALERRAARMQAEARLRAWEFTNLNPATNPTIQVSTRNRLAEGVSLAGVQAAQMVPNVGDPMTIRVPDIEATNACTDFKTVTGTVRVVGTEGIIVTDDANSSTNQLTLADLQELSDRLDNEIIATLEAYYGVPSDLDINERVIILLTQEVNQFFEGIVAGFVFSGDLFSPASCASSTNGEIFYGFVPDASRTRDQVKVQYPGLIAHEITHVIQQSRRLIVSQSPSPSLIGTWTAEGQATFSEEVTGHATFGNTVGQDMDGSQAFEGAGVVPLRPIDFYLSMVVQLGDYFGGLDNLVSAPHECTVFGQFQPPLVPEPPCDPFHFYGASWAFQRYVSDRYRATFPGGEEGLHKAIIDDNPTLSGRANWIAVLPDNFDDVFVQYAATLYADGRVAGLPAELQMNSWDLTDVMATLRDLFAANNIGPDPDGLLLTPESRSFTSFTSTGRRVRGGSTAYTTITGPGGAVPALAIDVTDAGGNTLGGSFSPRLWILRTK